MKFQIKGDYFDGRFHDNNDIYDTVITRECPANTDEILYRASVSYKNIAGVLESAEKGFKSWRYTSIEERIALLKKYQNEVTKIKDQVAESIALESGKPIWEALGEAGSVIGKVDVTINDGLKRIQ